ncbi:hypothetical protein GW17_00020181 [Ensete ventricosum]|nr:hypothetical protein GW17_00020181 [Ensete ventricosum]
MSSASSHFESQSVELSTHRSRVLSCPSGDSVSVAVVPSTSALGDLRTANALAAMRSFFNVDLTVTTRQLVEVRKNYFIPPEYELHVPLSGERTYDAFSFPIEWTSRMMSSSVTALSVDEIELVEILRAILSLSRGVKDMNERFDGSIGSQRAYNRDAGVSTVEKRPSSDAEVGLRKCLRKVAAEQLVDTSESTTRTSADKGKGTVELGEVPKRGYTMRELCKIEDRVGADRYFASIMMRLKCVKGEDPLVPRRSTISGSNPFWTEGLLSEEYLWGALHPTLAKQVYKCSSKELMNRAGKLAVWASVGQELAATIERRAKELKDEIKRMMTELESLKTKLKVEGQKAVTAYKGSQGFESDLEKMGRVSYEFGYWVALERLRGKHPDIMIKLDPFAECLEDANVEMDLDQPFNDSTPSEKQPTS